MTKICTIMPINKLWQLNGYWNIDEILWSILNIKPLGYQEFVIVKAFVGIAHPHNLLLLDWKFSFCFTLLPDRKCAKTFRIKQKITAVANYCNSRFCYQLAFCGSFTRDIILPQARISKISGMHLTAWLIILAER